MAFEDYDDYEKSEVVAKWLRENASSIISGLVLGLLLIFGINQWRQHQVNHRADAATEYQNLLGAAAADDSAGFDAAAGVLRDRYKDTPFGVFAALHQADRALREGRTADATQALTWARGRARDKAMKTLIQLRIARVELAADDAEAAIRSLDTIAGPAYAGMAAELRGDALAALDQPEAAREAYQKALDSYQSEGSPAGVVQLKIDNLPAAETRGS